jgi:sortase (surface protein transpeptidase)
LPFANELRQQSLRLLHRLPRPTSSELNPYHLDEVIVATRNRTVLTVVSLAIAVGGLAACAQPPETASLTAGLAAALTPTEIATTVPTIEASPTAPPPTIADSPSSTSVPSATFTELPASTPTPAATSTPIATPELEATPTAPVPTATPKPTIAAKSAGSASIRAAGAPVQLLIPKIGVKASIESVGMDRVGAMATPSGPYTVGWWKLGTVPGDPGNAVIDGHLDSARVGAAVFWYLGELRAGDQILVKMSSNRTLTFVVDRLVTYPYDQAPLTEIFGASSTPSLNLVTCSGSFDKSSHNYNRRLVVYSHLANG